MVSDQIQSNKVSPFVLVLKILKIDQLKCGEVQHNGYNARSGGVTLHQGWKANKYSLIHLSETTSQLRTFPLQDSITTWLVTGISLSKSHGKTLT